MTEGTRKPLLPPWAQSLGALAGAFSAGVLLAAFPGLPAQVGGNTARLAAVEAKLDRVICILELPNGVAVRPTQCVFPVNGGTP